MPVDHAEVLRRFKAHIAAKPSHGQRDLLAELGRLEAECGVEPDQYRLFLSRFGGELEEAFLNIVPPPGETPEGSADPLTDTAASASAMAETAPPSIGAESATEDTPCPTPAHRPHRPHRQPRTATSRPTSDVAPRLAAAPAS